MKEIEFRLRALQIHFRVSIRKLNNYLQTNTPDENDLVKLLERMEYQEYWLKFIINKYFNERRIK